MTRDGAMKSVKYPYWFAMTMLRIDDDQPMSAGLIFGELRA
jgi:hypothetical protein